MAAALAVHHHRRRPRCRRIRMRPKGGHRWRASQAGDHGRLPQFAALARHLGDAAPADVIGARHFRWCRELSGAAMRIRPARVDDAAGLTAVALRAKAQWGYASVQLDAWRDELRVTPELLVAQTAFVAETDRIVGFYTLRFDGGRCELDNLWLLPDHMRQGLGRQLLAHACATAAARGASQLHVDADPNAAPFYEHCGAVVTGHVPAPIDGDPGRVRPQLVLSLRDRPSA